MIPNMFLENGLGSEVYLCSDRVLHVGQSDNWSCGYRNLQMLLSVLLITLGQQASSTKNRDCDNNDENEGLSSNVTTEENSIDSDEDCVVIDLIDLTDDACSTTVLSGQESFGKMSANESTGNRHPLVSQYFQNLELPDLATLQLHIEEAWKEQFDEEGALHYGGQLRGSKEWIGAVEVASLLNYFYCDATVIQFIEKPKSRATLGAFVYWYFNSAVDTEASEILKKATCNFVLSERSLHKSMVNLVGGGRVGVFKGSKFPLYLQWKGHSVSIIGIEISKKTTLSKLKPYDKNKTATALGDINLLCFDPQKKSQTMKAQLLSASVASTKKSSGSSWQHSVRLPVTKLMMKDCQIICCRSTVLSEYQRSHRKKNAAILTA